MEAGKSGSHKMQSLRELEIASIDDEDIQKLRDAETWINLHGSGAGEVYLIAMRRKNPGARQGDPFHNNEGINP